MARTITIEGRYCGPPGLGNGGYVCGVVAGAVSPDPGQAVEVTLRKGTPIDRPLALAHDDTGARLCDGDDVLVSARPAGLDLTAPAPPDFTAAERAATNYQG